MFNIGGGELLVILLVALIVLGPNRLPGAARQVGQFVGELRRMSSGFQQELRDALEEPLDGFDLDPGWNNRRRGPSRQAELRRGSANRPRAGRPGEDKSTVAAALPGATPPAIEPGAGPGAVEDAAGAAAGRPGGRDVVLDGPGGDLAPTGTPAGGPDGAAARVGDVPGGAAAPGTDPVAADPTAASGPVNLAPAAPDAAEPGTDPGAADPTAASGPVTLAPAAPDAAEPGADPGAADPVSPAPAAPDGSGPDQPVGEDGHRATG